MYSSTSWHVHILIYSLSSGNGSFLSHKSSVMFTCSQSAFPVLFVPDNLWLIFFPHSIAFSKVLYKYSNTCGPLLSFNIWKPSTILCESLHHYNQSLIFWFRFFYIHQDGIHFHGWSMYMCLKIFPVFLVHESMCTCYKGSFPVEIYFLRNWTIYFLFWWMYVCLCLCKWT